MTQKQAPEPSKKTVKLRLLSRLGRGFEGIVFKAVAVVRDSTGRLKKRLVTVKHFDPVPLEADGTWGDPQVQLRHLQRIETLNVEKKLGLRIVSNVHIAQTAHGPVLVHDYLPDETLSAKQQREFGADAARQLKLLRHIGYDAHLDAFFAQIEPVTGQGIAVIADFGHFKTRRGKFPILPFGALIAEGLGFFKSAWRRVFGPTKSEPLAQDEIEIITPPLEPTAHTKKRTSKRMARFKSKKSVGATKPSKRNAKQVQ